MSVRTVPIQVEYNRRQLCSGCITKCNGYLSGALQLAQAQARCPLPQPRWMPYTVGLGTAVAMVAQPIAKAVDAVANTTLAQCGGCAGRKAGWNKKVPDIMHPWRRNS